MWVKGQVFAQFDAGRKIPGPDGQVPAFKPDGEHRYAGEAGMSGYKRQVAVIAGVVKARRLAGGIFRRPAAPLSGTAGRLKEFLEFSDGLPFGMLAEMDGRGWFSLIGLSIGATVLSYAWYFEGVKTLGAGSAAAYITLVPVFGILCSAWFLGEALHVSLVAGCLAAVVGLALMQYGRRAV